MLVFPSITVIANTKQEATTVAWQRSKNVQSTKLVHLPSFDRLLRGKGIMDNLPAIWDTAGLHRGSRKKLKPRQIDVPTLCGIGACLEMRLGIGCVLCELGIWNWLSGSKERGKWGRETECEGWLFPPRRIQNHPRTDDGCVFPADTGSQATLRYAAGVGKKMEITAWATIGHGVRVEDCLLNPSRSCLGSSTNLGCLRVC